MHLMDLEVRQRMEYRIGPAQLLLVELLVLPVDGLAERLEAELAANPALELPDSRSCQTCGRPLWRGSCPHCRNVRPIEPAPLRAPVPAREQLLSDATTELRPADRPIAAYLVADVDELGLLTEPLAAVAARLGCTTERVGRVIHALRRAGAPGLCAGTLAERLTLQVAATAPGTAVPDEVPALLSHGLDALAAKGPREAATASGLTPQQVQSGIAWLRAHIAADIIEPDAGSERRPVDVIVRRQGGELVVETVAGPWSAVRVAPMYLALADDPRIQPQVTRARRFVEALDRRECLLTKVCAVVLGRQPGRAAGASPDRRSLSRRAVAAELGVHESTVSRTVAGKYLLLPSGRTVALATFFGAADGPRETLRDLVADEAVPLSDAELARRMAGRGHAVARRTIAKYRAELGIPQQRSR